MEEFEEFYYSRLINYISRKIYTGFDLEFIGILKDFNLYEDKQSITFLEYLIKCKIYIEVKEMPHYICCSDILEIIRSKNSELDNLDGFIYNDKNYIYNFKIYSEIYKITEYVIENTMSLPLENDIIYIISELKGIIDNDDKISFLKEKIKFYWKPFENSSSFLLFMNEKHDWEGQNWEDEIRSELTWDEHFILFYITCSKHENLEQTYYYRSTYKLWIENYRKKKLIDFCKTELENIKELLNVPVKVNKSANTDKIIKSDIIFKEDYECLFNYVVTEYSGTKNKAFFSYLFHFFSDNKFLLKNIKSSVAYKNYLVGNNFIDKYSKVIQRNTENSDEEKRMFDIFNKSNDKFIQINIEGKLKEN
jgi:hypothetical protein